MTIEEVFNKLASHMCEGIKFHDKMAEAYDYLNFEGLYKCHMSCYAFLSCFLDKKLSFWFWPV